MASPTGTSPPFVRSNSPSLGIRRGTVADVRSLSRKTIVIEGWLRFNRGKDAPTRHWFQLDAGPDLRAFGSRPFTDAAVVQFAVPLDEVSQVVRIKGKNEFRLCDATMKNVAHLVCDDESNLLWWLHGFQRRIFEQTKGFLRQQQRVVPVKKGSEAALRPKGTVDDAKLRRAASSPTPSQWLSVMTAAQMGRRKNMEDETLVVLDINDAHALSAEQHGALSLISVFDGHAGRECAEYAAEFLLPNLLECPLFAKGDLAGALSHAYVQTDREFRDWAVENECIAGSTAITVLIRDTTLFVANCGDCRAVLCRGGQAVDLSSDHKPNRADERARVERAGGWVEDNEVLNIPKLHAMGLAHRELLDEEAKLIGWVVVSKVMGALAMTRSFGDILIKDQLSDNFDSALDGGQFGAELILSQPEVREERVTARDQFLVVACDGLWDVFSSMEACVFVTEALLEGVPRAAVADSLIARAIAMGSLDNISVVIVFFDHGPEPPSAPSANPQTDP